MLGPFSDSTYSAITFPLAEGDRIILITDGIVEAADSSSNEFGMNGLKQIVESKHALPPNRFVDALLYGLSSWSEHVIGTGQADDITLLAIGFMGHG